MKNQTKRWASILLGTFISCATSYGDQLEARDVTVAQAVKALWPDALVCVESPTQARVFHEHGLYTIDYKMVGDVVVLGTIIPEAY